MCDHPALQMGVTRGRTLAAQNARWVSTGVTGERTPSPFPCCRVWASPRKATKLFQDQQREWALHADPPSSVNEACCIMKCVSIQQRATVKSCFIKGDGVFLGKGPNVTVIVLFPYSCVKDRQSQSAFSARTLNKVNTKLKSTATQEGQAKKSG